MLGLHCQVYRGAAGHDCTLGGVTSKFAYVTAIGEHVKGPFEPDEKNPAVVIEKRFVCGHDYWTAYPCDEHGQKLAGWYMFGGNFISTSDSRFPSLYPIPVHDRLEK